MNFKLKSLTSVYCIYLALSSCGYLNSMPENKDIFSGSSKNCVSLLTDRIHSFLTTDANGKPDTNPRSSVGFFTCCPSIPLNTEFLEEEYELSKTMNNNGVLELFSSELNFVPDTTSYILRKLDKSLTQSYDTFIHGANAIHQNVPESEQKEYDKADNYLNETYIDTDGKKKVRPSPVYAEYIEKRDAYDNAVSAHNEARNKFQKEKTPENLEEVRRAKKRMDNAYKAWVAAKKTEVERNLNIMATSLKSGVAHAINKSTMDFEASQKPSSYNGDVEWYPVWTYPLKFWDGYHEDGDSSNNKGWTEIEIDTTQENKNSQYYTRSFDADLSYDGAFYVKIDGKWVKDEELEDDSTHAMKMKMALKSVSLNRPYLNTSWFSLKNWYVSDADAHQVSPGYIQKRNSEGKFNANEYLLPAIPTKMVLGKDIELSATWSEKTRKKIAEKINLGLEVSYGSFNLSGHYSSTQKQENVTSFWEGDKIKINGLHIIGFECSAPPKSAPEGRPIQSIKKTTSEPDSAQTEEQNLES